MEESLVRWQIGQRRKTQGQLHGRPGYYFHEEKRIRTSESIYPLLPEGQSNIEDSVFRLEKWLDNTVNSP
jgi:hypothetical protein